MSKEPEKLICDWCKKLIEEDKPRFELKVFNKDHKDDKKVLDCCVKCFNEKLAPKEGTKRGFSLAF